VHDIILLIAGAVLGGLATVVVSRPKVTLSIAVPADMQYYRADGHEAFRSLRINVANAARWWTIMAPAVACRATVTFYNNDGHDFFGRSTVGRWANSPAPQPTLAPVPGGTLAVFDLDRFNRESRLDIFPAESEPIDIAARFQAEADCYVWNNETQIHPTGRPPQWRLPAGVFLVKVGVVASGRPHVGYFRIHNDGPTLNTFRMEMASPDEVARIRARSARAK
jgi:hypothetical protein